MKDLEKIKSEDLAVQVQDANPADFAIEQEVAQLVGATVPAPTEPSADDARELGAQLLVFLRRALLPIRSALRTAVAAIYAHLDSRCTDYTPAAYAPYQPLPSYDPMGTPPTPRTLPNLLTALTAFSARKISNGSAPNDGIKDGISLARLLGSSDLAAITEIKDDTPGWTMDRSLPTMNRVTKATIGCKTLHAAISGSLPNAEELNFPDLDHIDTGETGAPQTNLIYGASVKKVNMPALKRFRVVNASYSGVFYNLTSPCEILAENCTYWDSRRGSGYPVGLHTVPGLTRLVVGKMTYFCPLTSASGATNLIDIEIGQDTACDLYLEYWNPTDKGTTFLQNFREHIALRLTSNGSGKTLTLSQAVRDAIHAAEATYGIEAIIVTQKGWTLSPAPGASSQ